jgi:uncharacterized protein (TIGR02453 family)
MPQAAEFKGFSAQTGDFFNQLVMNNNKAWFDQNRADYEEYVLEPARAFILAMGEALRPYCPGLNAIPQVNKSIFRLNRDVRFSKDKTPYKTHLGIWMWEGEGKRMECPGFYFHFQPPSLMLGGGRYVFDKAQLEAYRESVVHEKHGKTLAKIVQEAAGAGLEIGVKHYKRVPRGYDREHPNADLLLHNGLTAMHSELIPQEFSSADLVEYCLGYYKKMLPMHRWLLEMVERA